MVPAPGLTTAILTGPTATGKTALALELARKHPAIEIVNADSLLVYRGMDIGTAKPTSAELQAVPHHLIDIRDPNQSYTAGDFLREAKLSLADIHSRGKRALIVGGTGFYLKTLLYGLWDAPAADPALRTELEAAGDAALHGELLKFDPDSAHRIGPNDHYRLVRAIELLRLTGKTPTELQKARPSEPDPSFPLFVIDRDPEELNVRVSQRTGELLVQGLVEEARKIRERFPDSRALGAVGYAQVIAFLDGVAPEGREPKPGIVGLREEIELATRQLVKRQRTWFRGEKTSRWFRLEEDRARLLEELERIYAGT